MFGIVLPKPFLEEDEADGSESKRRELEALNFRVRVDMERNLDGMDREPGREKTINQFGMY